MTEAGTLCINADVVKKAGIYCSGAYATSETYTNVAIPMAEGFICAQARYDFVTNSGSVSVIGKQFLKNVCSSLAALDVLKWDMGVYPSRTAETMIDMNNTIAVEGINLLKDDKYRDFVIHGAIE